MGRGAPLPPRPVAALRLKNKLKDEEEDEIEDWELEYWPHRFSYEELSEATDGFSNDQLLGSSGFGRVFKGTLLNNTEIAIKCVNHDSKQGLREFMAEISIMGKLQPKNLVQMRGWCRKGNELMLVYDYMPNGSLNRWIFDKPKKLLTWEQQRRVLADVAEGLNSLHHGWDQVVVHRDIKSSNILLDIDMRGRLGDFGLAKLYQHDEVPNTTRVVGTLGYLAPEAAIIAAPKAATVAAPTAASDVYSFGVVVLEVGCGRRPIDMEAEEDKVVLIDWVRDLYAQGKVCEAADVRINGDEYEKEEMEGFLKLGLACYHPDPQRRPSMKEVFAVLVGDQVAAVPAELLSELALVEEPRLETGKYFTSSSGDVCPDMGITVDPVRRETERKRLVAVLYLKGLITMVPLPDGGYFYVDTQWLEQFESYHRYKMFHWYIKQVREDPREYLRTLRACGLGGR